jgi:glucose uptake protein
MIMELSPSTTWFLMILSMVCWGSWANSFKLTRGIRFELFYWDYAAGLLIMAIFAGMVVGHYSPEANFPGSLLSANSTPLLWAMLSGVVFNLANLLLVAAIAVAGLAVAFPVAIGTALIVGATLTFLVDRTGTPVYIFTGVIFAAVAVVCCAAAYRTQTDELKVTPRGVVICLVSGLLMASWAPLAAASMQRAYGFLTPLASFVVFAAAAFVSTIPFNLYFMRRPIIGAPVVMKDYLAGGIGWHLLGFAGGAIWSIGTVSNLIAGHSAGFAISYAVGQTAPLVASLWGIFVWKEFAGAGSRSKRALIAMFFFYAVAIAVLSQAA